MRYSLSVMMLAAGEGLRLRPYTQAYPKPIIPLLTVPLASYSFSLLEEVDIKNFVVNTYHLPQKIEYFFSTHRIPAKKLIFSNEKEKLLGSGGGIHAAKPHLLNSKEFLVVNADEVILPHSLGLIPDLISFHQFHKGIATLLTMRHPGVGTHFGGVWTESATSEVKLFSKVKPTDHNLEGFHFIGVMLLDSKIFNYFSSDSTGPVVENILYNTLKKAILSGEKVYHFLCDVEWFEVGNPKDFIETEVRLLDAINNKKCNQLWWVNNLKQIINRYSLFNIQENNPQNHWQDRRQDYHRQQEHHRQDSHSLPQSHFQLSTYPFYQELIPPWDWIERDTPGQVERLKMVLQKINI